MYPSHSLSFSQTIDLHEWFYSLQAIILPSLLQCFLKYACPTFPNHLPNSNGCPLLLPLFVSASSPHPASAPIMPLLPSCLCSLQLLFICGWPNFQGLIHPAVFRQTEELQIDWLTDRQAGIDASAEPITVPKPPHRQNNSSPYVALCQTRLCFFVFKAPDMLAYTHAHAHAQAHAQTQTQTHTHMPPAPPGCYLQFGLMRDWLSHWITATG